MNSDYKRECDVQMKLISGTALDSDDELWILGILETFRIGDDASKRKIIKQLKAPRSSRKEDLHFWVAADYAHRSPGTKARGEVAVRWGLKDGNVEKIVQRQKSNVDHGRMKYLLATPGFSDVIEWHRIRLTDN